MANLTKFRPSLLTKLYEWIEITWLVGPKTLTNMAKRRICRKVTNLMKFHQVCWQGSLGWKGPRKLKNVVKTTNSAKGHWPSSLKRLFKRIEMIWLKDPRKLTNLATMTNVPKFVMLVGKVIQVYRDLLDKRTQSGKNEWKCKYFRFSQLTRFTERNIKLFYGGSNQETTLVLVLLGFKSTLSTLIPWQLVWFWFYALCYAFCFTRA